MPAIIEPQGPPEPGAPAPALWRRLAWFVGLAVAAAATLSLADGVRVNVLQLGGFFNHQPEKFVEMYSDCTMLKRMANDTDIMGAIVWLASDASAYVTGASIPIDGGYSAK